MVMVSSEFVKAVFRQGNRRSGESRNPEPSVAGPLFSRRISWIPAFAGTTVGGNDGGRE